MYETEKGTTAEAIKLLELHTLAAHSLGRFTLGVEARPRNQTGRASRWTCQKGNGAFSSMVEEDIRE